MIAGSIIFLIFVIFFLIIAIYFLQKKEKKIKGEVLTFIQENEVVSFSDINHAFTDEEVLYDVLGFLEESGQVRREGRDYTAIVNLSKSKFSWETTLEK